MSSAKLVIQTVCYNEFDQIADCLRALPRTLPGIAIIETLVIDDGSTDHTAEQARAAGAIHVLKLEGHAGLARAHIAGLEYACTELQADYVVNFDADRQYLASDIPALLEPLLNGEADYVLGQRAMWTHPHFGMAKKCLQCLGAAVVSLLTGIRLRDATTGFRAITRSAGMRLSVWTRYTYTLETLFQAADLKLRVRSVPIGVNRERGRPSRLVKSTGQYCWQSMKAIGISLIHYRPCAIIVVLTLGVWCATGLQWGSLAVLGFAAALACLLMKAATLNRRVLEQIRYEIRCRNATSLR